MSEKEPFILDPSKISRSEKADSFRKATIEEVLKSIEQKKPFGPGDLVTTLDGPHAHIGLLVIELKEDGVVKIATAPNAPAIEIHESKLFHFDDYHEAFKIALVEEQIFNPDKPQ